ncbi:hypothetical protein SARC_03609 [Sphaeroforma arctica JP610]|uniref:Uncharacterized protein n=1 Tax=Sphaeroforma arctica JP610 TaxID=667725 RepID=A0A0L0G7G2_9EUKA|nr:hypothetical protein SARC_03609 [Sphaeroforma arctica JP610]KNC84153.1 hypothetical protein SARC_03609 [Sphaeroforma arctica JP610]|eukprot:XP_014158055.1 hypothetical protein SARC_03609 [Sphaeroforma arctica JP610]
MANVVGTNGDTFDQTCCQDIMGYEPTLPECSPVCNVVDVVPTCFQAVGLKGYTCAAGRVYKNLLSALLCPSTGDFDRVCCEAHTCDQAHGLDGFLCAQGSVYAPSLASVKVFAAAEFNAKCCETNVNVLNLCGNLVGTNNNVCGND